MPDHTETQSPPARGSRPAEGRRAAAFIARKRLEHSLIAMLREMVRLHPTPAKIQAAAEIERNLMGVTS